MQHVAAARFESNILQYSNKLQVMYSRKVSLLRREMADFVAAGWVLGSHAIRSSGVLQLANNTPNRVVTPHPHPTFHIAALV